MEIRIDEKIYRTSATPRQVLADVTLEIPPCQVCAVAGPSGVGKSTFLSIVAGLDTDYDGHVSDRPSPLGFMFQTPRLLPWATVLRNVQLAIPGREAEAARWIDAMGLAGNENTYPEKLSLGMARRVGLARALAVRPALLLLDEPFASLDPATAEMIQAVLRAEIVAREMTVLLVTHEMQLASDLADRIVVLDGIPGRIVRDVIVTAARLPRATWCRQGGLSH